MGLHTGPEVALVREAIMQAEYCAGKFVQTSRQSLRLSAPNPTPRSVAAGRAIDA